VAVPAQIGGGTDTYTANADLGFTGSHVNDSATVSDTEIGLSDEPVSGGDVCSSGLADYGEDNSYTEEVSNTAYLTDEEGNVYESTATTTYTCYVWDVSKTADGSYNNGYDWDITKTVDPESQSGFPGDTLEWTWSITWESFFVEEINHGAVTVAHESPVWTPVAYNMDDTGAWALIALDTDAFPWGIALQGGDLWAADNGRQVLMRLILSVDGDDGDHKLYLPSLRR
jgi:hypothetical protein